MLAFSRMMVVNAGAALVLFWSLGRAQAQCDTTTTTTSPSTTTTTLRFVDHGDGTVSDHQTGLQWEKKDTVCPGIHCVDDTYTWTSTIGGTAPDGSAFVTFLSTLNGGPTGVGNCASPDGSAQIGGFAGHCDWRLPTIAELQTILLMPYPCSSSPCLDPVFGPTAEFYWTSTTYSGDLTNAWLVHFTNGFPGYHFKTSALGVRAVRGGS